LGKGKELVALDGAGVVLERRLLERLPKYRESRNDSRKAYLVQLHETLP